MKPADIEAYLDDAIRTAQRSKANRLKVGAVLVNPQHIVAKGYNGTPPGWDNACEDADNNTKPETIHAEMNALAKFANEGISIKGSTMFISHCPCMPCATSMWLFGVKRVYYCEDYRSTDGIEFLKKAGVEVIKRPSQSSGTFWTAHNRPLRQT